MADHGKLASWRRHLESDERQRRRRVCARTVMALESEARACTMER